MADDAQVQDQIQIGSASDPFADDSLKQNVGERLGLKDLTEIHKNQHQIERLIQWAQAKGSKDSADVLWNIGQLANRIGKAPFGQSMAKHLSTYAYLEMERLKLDKQIRQMEG